MDKLIGELDKTDSVKTLVRVLEFKGRDFLDIRDFFKPKNQSTYVPTKKGIMVDIKRISDILSIMEQAEAFVAQETKTKTA